MVAAQDVPLFDIFKGVRVRAPDAVSGMSLACVGSV
ncbi:hypothetical protein CGLO_09300 [Colletotrichum gloeosporioides Cg-14]|uniref:Uncharacterized protein n=1 Tax=Colletotrichum gloeosporioides (strain Cg-14) TaxID=1237896 RepID=T0K6S4_COLGC|nr:hypothetical protein CGLO_09300 [Colletotrichum gloeosporioides Cg-14]